MANRCYWYDSSRNQREKETERGLNLEGTIGFEIWGCLSGCQGYNGNCSSYIDSVTIMKALNNDKAKSEDLE